MIVMVKIPVRSPYIYFGTHNLHILPKQQFLQSFCKTGTNRHQNALYDIYIVSPALSKTDRPGLGAGTVPAQEAPTTTYPNIAAQYRP